MRARVVLPLLILALAFAGALLLQHVLTKDTMARARERKAVGPDTLQLEIGGDHPRLRLPPR